MVSLIEMVIEYLHSRYLRSKESFILREIDALLSLCVID